MGLLCRGAEGWMEGAAPAAERGSERSEEEAAAIAAEAAAAAAAAVEEEQEEHAEVFDNLMPLCIRFFWLSGLAGWLAGWLARNCHRYPGNGRG